MAMLITTGLIEKLKKTTTHYITRCYGMTFATFEALLNSCHLNFIVNQLVLQLKLDTTDEHSCVLILEGSVPFSGCGHHVLVLVDISGSSQKRMTYQTYRIGTDMGCCHDRDCTYP